MVYKGLYIHCETNLFMAKERGINFEVSDKKYPEVELPAWLAAEKE
jgi:hypothetical protein